MDISKKLAMELYIWDGEPSWSLPSMELKSFQMLMYIKLSAAPVTVIKCMNPFSAPHGTLPSFKCPEGILTDFSAMTKYLKKQNYNCDEDLSPRECADVLAYQHLLEEKLYPALTYLWWVEHRSYQEVIHKWYFSKMSYPFKLWIPGTFHNNAKQFIHGLLDESDDEIALETEVLKHAQECLTLLSNKLGENEFFFGAKPSTLDALLLPYIALLLKVDIMLPVLQNYIRQCPNFTRYVFKTLHRFYPEVVRAEKEEKKRKKRKSTSDGHEKGSNTSEQDKSDAGNDFPNKGRNLVLSGLVAATAMFGYAVATGLVQVGAMEGGSLDDEYEDVEYDDDEE